MATKSYSQAYAGLSAEKKSSMTEAQFTTKAKAWNQKKYGTTEPTAKAKKMTGGSKPKLAKEKADIDHMVKTATHGINSAAKSKSSTNIGMRKEGEKRFSAPGDPGRVHLEKGTTKAKVFTPSGGIQPLRAIDLSINATDTKSNATMQNTITAATKTRKEKRFDRRTEAGRRTKEITTDNAGTVTKTIRKGKNTKKTVTRDSGGNKTVSRYRNP